MKNPLAWAALLALLPLCASAQTIIVGPIDEDDPFGFDFIRNQYEEEWVAQIRAGDLTTTPRTFEVSVNDDTATNPEAAAQFNYTSGDIETFRLQYTAATGEVSFTFNGLSPLVATYPGAIGNFDTLAFRTRDQVGNNVDADITISVNSINGISTGDASFTLTPDLDNDGTPGEAKYLVLADIFDTNGDFDIIGDATMSWVDGFEPKNSQVLFEIKAGTVIPEPSTYALILLGLSSIAFILFRRRRG